MTISVIRVLTSRALNASTLLAMLCICTVLRPAIADSKPNVIMIMADDIGFECYSGYGSQFYSTPNIDRLAKTGAKFTQAYAQPICTPSRVKIMTGRYNLVDMVAYMDKTIGRIVTKLDELGLRENTLILVTGDNGTNKSITSPFPGRGQIKGGKGLTTDAGTRVAFVANWPGQIKPGTVIGSPIDFSCVLPTIGEVTGSTVPAGTDGQSFLPLLRGDSSDARDWIFVSYSRNGLRNAPFKCFVRDRRWKLYADGSLYDVPNDWLEQSPVTGPQTAAVRKRLQPLLNRILKETPKTHIQFNVGKP